MTRTPLPGAWTGAELASSGQWMRGFDDGHRAEIAAALAAVKAAGLPETGFGKAAFVLDRTATTLADVTKELEEGCGAIPAEARGVPVLA